MAVKSVSVGSLPQGTLSAGIAFGLLTSLIWGSWPVMSRLGVEQSLNPADVAFLRFAVAGLILLPIFLRRGVRGLGWGRGMVLAAGAGVSYVMFSVSGFTLAPAGHGGVIIPSTMLTCAAVGAWLLLGERPPLSRVAGLVIILAGVLTIGWHSLAQGGPDTWKGDLMFMVGGMLWAVYTLGSRAWGADPWQATAIVSVFSLVVFLPYYIIFHGDSLLAVPLSELLIQGVYQGVVAGILALLFYTKAVAILGAARAAVFAAFVPAITALLAYPLLGEVPAWREMLGIAVVSLGMLLALGLVKWPRRGAGR